MIKRLIAILLCVCTLFVTLPVTAAAEGDSRLDEAIVLMKMMEAIPTLDTADMTGPITRAEFSLALARMLRVDTSAPTETRYFTDIPMVHWAHTAVNTLVDMKILSQPEDKLFYPDEPIARNEAIKMMACALGYQVYAEFNGGYPYGYLTAATEAKILNGVGGGDVFTLADALILFRNTACAEVYEVSSVWNGYSVYANKEGKTLLSIYWDTYEGEGYAEAVYGISLTDKMAGKGEAIIDGVSYLCGSENAELYVGQDVRFYYHQANEEEKGELIYIASDASDGEVVEFTAEEFISYNSGTVYYLNEENGKELKFTLASGEDSANVIKNGSAVIRDISKAFEIENGEVRAIDADGDGRFETVFIWDCQLLQVSTVDTVQEVVCALDTEGNKASVAKKPNQILRIQTADNANADFSVFTRDAVLHMYESEEVLTVFVTKETVTGTLEEVSAGGDSTVTVSGTVYPISNELAASPALNVGTSYTYFMDRYGKIAFVGSGSATGMVFGFLHKARIMPGLDKKVTFRVFTEADGLLEIADNGKLILDGERMDPEEALAHLGTYAVSQLILLRRDDNGLVAEVDTRYRGETESEYSLSCVFEDLAEVIFFSNSGYSKFDRLGTFNTANLRFIVPNRDVLEEAEEKDFIAARSGYFSNNTKFNGVRLYTVNPDDLYDTIALAYSAGATGEHRPMLIDKITTGLNERGDIVQMVSGIENNYVTIPIAAEYQADWDKLNLGQGDVVLVETNAYNEIVGATVKLHYTAGAAQPDGLLELTASPSQVRDLTGGYVLQKVGNDVEWCYGSDINTPYERLKIGNDVKIAVFDSTLRENKVYLGTVDDILDAESVGIGNASAIMLYAEYNRIGNIILHKRGWDD